MVLSSLGERGPDVVRRGRRGYRVVAVGAAVWFASAGVAVAADWKIQPIPRGVGVLGAVSCTSERACTAVGVGTKAGTPVLRWNGTSWSIQQTVSPVPSAGWSFAGVSCPSATDCIAVGFWATNSRSGALAERWDGASWYVLSVPSPRSGVLGAVSCTSAAACTAVGYYGHGFPLIERWNGSSWSIQRAPAASSTLTDVSCTARTLCTAVGTDYKTGQSIAIRWRGRGWSLSQAPYGGTDINGVSCTSARACAWVGDYDPASGPTGPVAGRWDGTRWSEQAISTNRSFFFSAGHRVKLFRCCNRRQTRSQGALAPTASRRGCRSRPRPHPTRRATTRHT